jgi:hypothetical protein
MFDLTSITLDRPNDQEQWIAFCKCSHYFPWLISKYYGWSHTGPGRDTPRNLDWECKAR